MSKEFENMDDLFQSAFADESAQVPAFVKQNIDKRLGFDQKKKGWMFWTGGVMLLIVAAILIVNLIEYPYEQNQTAQLDSDENNSNHYSQSQNHTDNANTLQTEYTTESENSDRQNEQLNKPSTANNSKNGEPFNARNKTYNSNKTSNESTDESNQNTGSQTEDGVIQKRNTDSKTDNKTQGSSTTTGIFGNSNGSAKIEYPASNDNYTTRSLRKNNLLTYKQVNPFVSASNLKISSPDEKQVIQTEHPSAVTIDSRETKSPWMISFTGGLDFSKSIYSSPVTDEATLYNNATSEKPGYHLTFGTTYSLNNGIQVGTGAGFSILSENYHYTKTENQIDTTYTWLVQDIYEYDSLLDTTIWIGVDSTLNTNYDTTITQLYDETGETKATYLQIPLSIGYQFAYKKFLIDFALAGRFNYLIQGSGAYVANDLVQKFDKTNGQIYKRMYFDFIIQTTVHYQLTEHLYVSGLFRYRPPVGNIYQNVSFNRSLQSFQIGVGLSWKF